MIAALGALLLVGPVAYALVWTWLRSGGTSPPGSRVATCWGQPHPRPLPCGGEEPLATKNGLKKRASSGSPPPQDSAHQAAKGRGWGCTQNVATLPPEPLFSILIAARDEAATLPHLLEALRRQTLAPALFEVLIADDHSADATAALVAATAQAASFSLRLIALPPGRTGKKAALAAAEAQARAPWVVCTDADCRPGSAWLQAYADQLAAQPDLHFISGPVRLTPGGAWFDGLLGLEFAGLVGVGGACIARGRPTMCNGANLAFRRATFREVGGYADNQSLASGDDEFLLHKVHQRHPAGIRFLADVRAVVDTPAPATLRALLRQRVRWASKFAHYRTPAPRQLALLVLGTNVSLLLGLGLGVSWPALWPGVAAGWALKLGADAWLLWPTLRLLRRRRWLGWLLPLQLLYAPYGLAVGLLGQRGTGYQWKGRRVR